MNAPVATIQENYTLVEHQKLLERKPDTLSENVKVWTIKQDRHIRINYVEMTGELPLHIHPDADHTLMVLSGKVKVQIGSEFRTISDGDYISIPANVAHKYWPLVERVRLVSMDAPYYDPKKTVSLESTKN